jgi:hypothetical protein
MERNARDESEPTRAALSCVAVMGSRGAPRQWSVKLGVAEEKVVTRQRRGEPSGSLPPPMKAGAGRGVSSIINIYFEGGIIAVVVDFTVDFAADDGGEEQCEQQELKPFHIHNGPPMAVALGKRDGRSLVELSRPIRGRLAEVKSKRSAGAAWFNKGLVDGEEHLGHLIWRECCRKGEQRG